MGDFPKPFSGSKTKKQKREGSVQQAQNAAMQAVQEAGRFANTMRFGKPAKTRVFDFDDKLAAKEASSKKTKEMGGPNMKAPLEKALVGNQPNLNEGLKAAIEASPATMISTGMAGVDPMTGMMQQNQFGISPINPNALGSMQPQIPSITGQPVAGAVSYTHLTLPTILRV